MRSYLIFRRFIVPVCPPHYSVRVRYVAVSWHTFVAYWIESGCTVRRLIIVVIAATSRTLLVFGNIWLANLPCNDFRYSPQRDQQRMYRQIPPGTAGVEGDEQVPHESKANIDGLKRSLHDICCPVQLRQLTRIFYHSFHAEQLPRSPWDDDINLIYLTTYAHD